VFDRAGMGGEVVEGQIYGLSQLLKLGKVFVVGRQRLDFAPKIFNGIKVGGIRWQLTHGDAIDVQGKERLHGFGGVIPGPILNQKQMLVCASQHAHEKYLVTLGAEFTGDAVMKESP